MNLTWLRIERLGDGRYEADLLYLDGFGVGTGEGDEFHEVDGMTGDDVPGYLRRLADKIEEGQQ